MSQLKKIDLNAKSFIANGVQYYIESSLSVDRYIMFQMLQVECGYEAGFEEVYKSLRKIYDLCNERKFADIAVLTHSLLNGIKNIETRKIPALSMCALFINTKDEDRTIITDEMVDKKIADWTKEGLDILPFFQLAVSFIPSFADAYKELSLNISEAKEEVKKMK